MTRYIVIVIAFFVPLSLAMAQESPSEAREDLLKNLLEEGPHEQVTLEVDSLLLSNYNKLIAENMKSSGVPGYRIRIFSGSGLGAKEEQQQVRAKFLSLYRGLDAYNRYDAPYFKVYVGDCRTMSEALRLNERIKKDFPNSIIRKDFINLKSAE